MNYGGYKGISPLDKINQSQNNSNYGGGSSVPRPPPLVQNQNNLYQFKKGSPMAAFERDQA